MKTLRLQDRLKEQIRKQQELKNQKEQDLAFLKIDLKSTMDRHAEEGDRIQYLEALAETSPKPWGKLDKYQIDVGLPKAKKEKEELARNTRSLRRKIPKLESEVEELKHEIEALKKGWKKNENEIYPPPRRRR